MRTGLTLLSSLGSTKLVARGSGWISEGSNELGGGNNDFALSRREFGEGGINAAKLLRACGGCLGARRRRRAWKTAISAGEPSNGR